MPGRRIKKWNKIEKVLQHLYGVDVEDMESMNPVFGSNIKLPLSVSNKGDIKVTSKEDKMVIVGKNEEQVQPTFLNLALHFGLLEWIENNTNAILRKSHGKITAADLNPKFYEAAKREARREFNEKFVVPLRKSLLKYDIYLYCLPSVQLQLEDDTGAPILIEGDEVLCLLPRSVETAKKYNYTEEQIALLAPQVLWLIKNLCATKVITTREQLEEHLDGWRQYITPAIEKHVTLLIEEARPDLID